MRLKRAFGSLERFLKKGVCKMELKTAKFCIDCEAIFEGKDCPRCGDRSTWRWLREWVIPLNTGTARGAAVMRP